MSGAAGQPQGPGKILIYRIGHIGDTVVALPALWAIRRRFPGAHLTLLSNAHREPDHSAAEEVVPPESLIDQWMAYPSGDRGMAARQVLRLLIELRRRRFDALVYLSPRLRSAADVRRDLRFFRLAGIREVIGRPVCDGLPRRRPGEPLPFVEHEADYLLRRVKGDPSGGDRGSVGEMSLALTGAEHAFAIEWVRARMPAGGYRAGTVGIAPASKWASKRWPVERYAELGERLVRELGLWPVVLGGPEDRELGERLVERWGAGANGAGLLGVRTAAAVLAGCRFYVGNDTGAMHLAASVGTPCVVLMSAQDWPGRWHPYGRGHTVLRRQVDCEGCLLETCRHEGLRCLTEIGVEEVFRACAQCLRQELRTEEACFEGRAG